MKALRRIASAGSDGSWFTGGCRVIPPFNFRMAAELAKNAE